MKKSLLVIAIAAIAATAIYIAAFGAESAAIVPAPTVDNAKASGTLQTAVLAGGCFWGVQGVYQHVRGVRQVLSGYAGGEQSTAHYDVVGSGRTNHAESVQITFDPKEISYGELLQIFFSVVHDPTQLNRQGPDSGTQYRSAIFFNDESQKKIAQSYIEQLTKAGVFKQPIVTRVDSNSGFYAAEAYHQDYLTNNPRNPYIVYNDLPKVENLRRVFPAIYSGKPVLVAASR